MLTDDQKRILFHLGYEWWMFRAADDFLQILPPDDDPVRNALVESLAIHGRELICFFYDNKHRQGDWRVIDLGHGLARTQTLPHELLEWREKTNHRVAHLTAGRGNVDDTWNSPVVRQLLQERIDHVKAALDQDVPISWNGDYATSSALLCSLGRSSRGNLSAVRGPLAPTGQAAP